MSVWRAYAMIGAGCGLGSALRYLVALSLPGEAFPWATLAVNVLGSWLIAACVAYAQRRPRGLVARWQLFLAAGFCGGFTTFSLFGLEVMTLLARGHAGLALGYLLASLGLWLAGAWLGHGAGRRLAAARC